VSRFGHTNKLAGLMLAGLVAGLIVAPASDAGSLQPQGRKIFFGVSDTGDPADFGHFSMAVHKHPAVIESFRSWGSDFHGSIGRWRTARARPMIHITTADSHDGHEIYTPEAIAQGDGDDYLIRLNRLFWAKKMRAYVRPLGEPNRCINVYASYDCEGRLRDSAHTPFWYRRAFQRIYILLHGGGKRAKIDARLAKVGLPPLSHEVIGLPRSPIGVLWSTLPAGSPTVPQNRPRYFYPGNAYVDWVGTDFYSDNQDWKSLTGLYNRFSKKPFAIPEFGVSSGDDPSYVQHLIAWVKHHDRCQMLIYYQDFGSSNPYRIQNYPASLAMLDKGIHTRRFPAFLPGHPTPPPPPEGGIGAQPLG
jgi:hypothetical protein